MEGGERGLTVHQAFRCGWDPNVRQQHPLVEAAGTARDAFHWGLALCQRLLDAGRPVPHAASAIGNKRP
jgi:hypothetical protein